MLRIDPNMEPGVHQFRDHVEGKCNITHDDITKNIRRNIKRQLPQAQPFPVQKKVKMMLLCGGPSMKPLLPQIKKLRKRGWKIATVNGAHNWCLENGMKPSIHIMLDGRGWNKRFVENPIPECRYLVASQCNPEVFDMLEGYDVTIWHGVGKLEKKILDQYYNKRYVPVQGGSTVGTRAIHLLYMLGFRKIAIYGMDSCIKKTAHHAYSQPENDQDSVYVLRVGRRKFFAHQWMSAQADELMQMLPTLPDDLALDFRGDNMITYVIKYICQHGKAPKMTIINEEKL